jgi:hypothetical protein
VNYLSRHLSLQIERKNDGDHEEGGEEVEDVEIDKWEGRKG